MYSTTIGSKHRLQRTGGYKVERKFAEILLKSSFITKVRLLQLPEGFYGSVLENNKAGFVSSRHFEL